MHIYLVQHAEAVSKEIDPSRGLSEKGLKDIKVLANHVSGLDLSVQEIYHSGKKRALETATVLAAALRIEDSVTESDGLSPMDDPQNWYSNIQGLNRNVMLVGHLPHMEKLASLILCGNKEKKAVTFAMGCILSLMANNDNTWSVDWMLKPKMIISESVSNNAK